jgi:hypothetical protein
LKPFSRHFLPLSLPEVYHNTWLSFRGLGQFFYGEEMSYSEIGEALGLTTGNVGVMILRIKEKCVKFIKAKYGERL